MIQSVSTEVIIRNIIQAWKSSSKIPDADVMQYHRELTRNFTKTVPIRWSILFDIVLLYREVLVANYWWSESDLSSSD